jgi:threonine/homoserine/homoserine lactone efflux protein
MSEDSQVAESPGGIMSIESWLAFAAASTILLIIPGPTILTVISYSLTHGRSAAAPLIAAVALGDSTALALSLLGLGTLLATSAVAFTIVKWVGGAYLIYLGVKMFLASAAPSGSPTAARARGSRWKLFTNTYLVTATNPKGIIFFMAFLPQFVDPMRDVASQMWVLAITFVALATVNATLYAVFAGYAAKLLASGKARRWFNIGGGSLLSAAGIWTAFSRSTA